MTPSLTVAVSLMALVTVNAVTTFLQLHMVVFFGHWCGRDNDRVVHRNRRCSGGFWGRLLKEHRAVGGQHHRPADKVEGIQQAKGCERFICWSRL